eukprot:TRINITY_DN15891_c0_g1_i1.p1 TRINITY_DN15891_c0_g1~~TRINITY_DN15891_c0_g1_i1.p1  ORF type:complete len:672 (-),score=114.11 TRINITY_DN15891_c0_g1_i1:16-2031(-)
MEDFDALAAVEAVTGIPREQMICVYQTGSSLYGTREPTSDLDYIVIVDGYLGPLAGKDHLSWTESHINNVAEGEAFGHAVDVPVYEKSYWQFMLDEHVIWALLCHYLRDHHPQYVVLERQRFDVDLRLRKLLSSMQRNIGHNSNQSRKLWNKDVRRSKKRVAITITFVALALQLARNKTITDVRETAPLYFELRDGPQAWDAVQAWMRPRLDSLAETLTETCRVYATYATAVTPVQDFITALRAAGQFNSAYLWWIASIRAVELDLRLLAFPGTEVCGVETEQKFVQLLHHSTETPGGLLAMQQANGVCLSVGHGAPSGITVVAAPHRRFFPHDAEYADKIDNWPSAEAWRRVDGLTIVLFYWGGAWVALPCPTAEEAFPQLTAPMGEPFLRSGLHDTWAARFWQVWRDLGLVLPADRTRQYVFELVGPGLGTFCDPPPADSVVLHGVFDDGANERDFTVTGREQGWPVCERIQLVPQIKKHPPRTQPFLNELQALAMTTCANPFQNAGFVITGDDFRHRISIPCLARSAFKRWMRYPRAVTADERRRVFLLLVRATAHFPLKALLASVEQHPVLTGYTGELAEVAAIFESYCTKLEVEVRDTVAQCEGSNQKLQATVGKHPMRDVFWRFVNQGVLPFEYLCLGEQLLNLKQNDFLEELLLGAPEYIPNNW